MPERPSPLTMPEVTVCCRPKGLPMATTKSPTSSSRGVAERDLDQAFGRHFEHRDVRRHVAADHGGGQIAAVLQGDRDFGRVINHMGVCNDVAVFCIKDDTGACALELALAGTHVGDVEEPAEEGVLEQRVLGRALADGAAGGDVHDGRRDALDHGRERRHRGFADGRWQGGVACNRRAWPVRR